MQILSATDCDRGKNTVLIVVDLVSAAVRYHFNYRFVYRFSLFGWLLPKKRGNFVYIQLLTLTCDYDDLFWHASHRTDGPLGVQ